MIKKKIEELFRCSLLNHWCANPVKRFLFPSLLIVPFLLVQSCDPKGEDKPTVYLQLEKLLKKKTWSAESVKLSGDPQVGYKNFTISFSGTPGDTTFSYTVNGTPELSPWLATGQFSFSQDTPQSKLIRGINNDKLPVNYAVSETDLRITFNFSGTGYKNAFIHGRTAIRGDWIFTFK